MKILSVEDDCHVARTLQELVLTSDDAVDVATNGAVGLQMATAGEYDLIVLDADVSDLDGVVLCQQLRKRGKQTPILLLTEQPQDRPETTETCTVRTACAEACVYQSTDVEELLVRVQALLQRGELPPLPQPTLDPASNDVGSGQQVAELTAINQELRSALEQLRLTQAKLQQKNQELEAAYQTIEQERQQWRALFEHALDAIAITDDYGNYVDVNPATDQLFGVPRDQLLQCNVADFTDPELEFAQLWQQFLQQGQMKGEFCLYRPDGTQREVEYAAVANFVPGRHLSILRDMSNRKQTELALQESKQNALKFVALADNSAEFIGVCDMNFEPFYVNPAGIHMMGLDDPNAPRDASVQDFFFPEDQDFITYEFFPKVLREGRGEVEIRFRHFITGETLWMIYSVICIRDEQDQPFALATISRNISDRKRAEQKIQEQAVLLDIASNAIFVRDLDHRILYWNQGAERLYGWQASEAIGQPADELLHDHGGSVSVDERIRHLLARGEWEGELHKKTKANQAVIVQVRWTLVRGEMGQPKCILAVDTDITEKKQLETQFYRAQRLESLGTLASGIAHDLNNVLTPILGVAQLLRVTNPTMDVRSQRLLKLLEDSAKRGADMIQQILAFTRGTGGERVPTQVITILQEVITVIQQSFPPTVQIEQTIPAQFPYQVAAESTYLHQVFMNLCINARDAMPNGGTLSLSVDYGLVDQALARTNLDAQVGRYVVITVADTGTGIEPDVLDRIFDPFFTTKPVGQGTGLGLATVLGIVRNHGGFMQVRSEVGRGTQMKVYLPAIDDDAPVQEGHPDQHLNGNGELILLVDDDLAVQMSTQLLLESHNYRVVATNDGQDAIALFVQRQSEIQAVMLDIMMPNMSGITLIKTIKAIKPAVKIMAMSGLPANRSMALAAGANLFLSKPYLLEDLLAGFQSLFSARAAE